MFDGLDKDYIVEDANEADYLQRSAAFEIVFALGFFFDFICSVIIGYLIIIYSQEQKAGLYIDPITNLEVPSLVYVFNQQ